MTNQQYDAFAQEQEQREAKTRTTKAGEYAVDDNRFSNFETLAILHSLVKTTGPVQSAYMVAMKHFASIIDMLNRKIPITPEILQEKYGDLRIYLGLMHGMEYETFVGERGWSKRPPQKCPIHAMSFIDVPEDDAPVEETPVEEIQETAQITSTSFAGTNNFDLGTWVALQDDADRPTRYYEQYKGEKIFIYDTSGFTGCSKLPNYDTSGFIGCSKLPNYDTVEEAVQAARDCIDKRQSTHITTTQDTPFAGISSIDLGTWVAIRDDPTYFTKYEGTYKGTWFWIQKQTNGLYKASGWRFEKLSPSGTLEEAVKATHNYIDTNESLFN